MGVSPCSAWHWAAEADSEATPTPPPPPSTPPLQIPLPSKAQIIKMIAFHGHLRPGIFLFIKIKKKLKYLKVEAIGTQIQLWVSSLVPFLVDFTFII
jgi:hypothetical protein